jgi:hypothetical protein
MADYYPLIARAVAGLEKNTGEARRALYERARTALVAQLRGVVPALDESEITRERLALEEAVRKVEAETARRSRFDQPKEEPKAESKEQGKPKTEQIAARPGPMPRTTPVAGPAAAEAGRVDRPEPAARPSRPARPEPTARAEPTPPPETPAPRRRIMEDRPSLTSEVLKGYRDVMAEPPPPVPEADVFTPAAKLAPEVDRVEPPEPKHPELKRPELKRPELKRPEPKPPEPKRIRPTPDQFLSAPHRLRSQPEVRPEPDHFTPEPEPFRPEPDRLRPPAPRDMMPRESLAPASAPQPFEVTAQDMPDYAVPRPPAAPRIEEPEEEDERAMRPPRSYRGLVRMLVAVVIVGCLGGAAAFIYFNPGVLTAWIGNPFKSSTTPVATRDAATPRTNKIPDRVVGPGVPEFARPGSVAGPAVAQRVVLYEDDPSDPQGKQYVGSAIWRTELVSPGPGLAPELAVRADVEIPERRITMAWSIRRNTDHNLPASHTIEIMFNLPADFPHGGISNVPGIMMKQAEATRGTPLAGLAVKVTTGYFLIGLSAVESDLARNVQLLKERAWFDVPVLYNDSRRAIIAIEKGNPGERAFGEAFAAWGR